MGASPARRQCRSMRPRSLVAPNATQKARPENLVVAATAIAEASPFPRHCTKTPRECPGGRRGRPKRPGAVIRPGWPPERGGWALSGALSPRKTHRKVGEKAVYERRAAPNPARPARWPDRPGGRAVRPRSLTPHPLHRFYACCPSKSSHAGPPDPEGATRGREQQRRHHQVLHLPRYAGDVEPTIRVVCGRGRNRAPSGCPAQRCGLPVHARRAFLSCIGIQPHLIDKLGRRLWPSVITP